MTNRRTKFENYVDEEANRKNTTKARVRDKVEHPFRILKRIFGFAKVRYRGLWKNQQWLCAAFALVNLYEHRNRLVPKGALCLETGKRHLQRSNKQARTCPFRMHFDRKCRKSTTTVPSQRNQAPAQNFPDME
jgi:hypothetical protein